MSPFFPEKRGFTLIELLIVVAIIAILAAIAVPNFLEAQTRSKVSRQQANMRTVATAVEAYAVDNNEYPLTTRNGVPILTPPGGGAWLAEEEWKMWPGYPGEHAAGLTTPIAYLTGVDALEDIFRLPHNFSSKLANQIMWLPSEFYNIINSPSYGPQKNRYGLYTTRSAGPDTYYQNHAHLQGDYDAGGWNQASYDATNGTVSAGDIYRSQKRPGEDHI